MPLCLQNTARFTNEFQSMILTVLKVEKSDLIPGSSLRSNDFQAIGTHLWYYTFTLTNANRIFLWLRSRDILEVNMHCTLTLFDANDESLHTHMLSFTCLKEYMCFNMLPKFLYSPSFNFPLTIRCYIVVENTTKETSSAPSFDQNVMEINQEVALNQCSDTEVVPPQNSARELVTETKYNDTLLLERLQELSVNLKNLLDQAVGTDLTIHVDGVSVKAHKMILRARSPVFEKMFDHDTSEAVQNEIDVKDVSAPIMKEFLTFLYTGTTENHDFDDACDLYYAADKYEVLSLRNACAKDLLRHLQVNNACQLLSLATNHGDESLKEEILEYIKTNFTAIVLTKSFEELAKYDANLVVLLMRNHVLYRSEQ